MNIFTDKLLLAFTWTEHTMLLLLVVDQTALLATKQLKDCLRFVLDISYMRKLCISK